MGNEVDCVHCNGTGKINICSLCNSTGYVSRYDGTLGAYLLEDCPEGCAQMKNDDKTSHKTYKERK